MKFYKQCLLIVLLFLFGAIQSKGQITISPNIQFNGCNGTNGGFISLDVSGGNAPYTYLWSTGSTNNFLGLIPAGIYDLTVTDSDGLTAVESMELTEPPALLVSDPLIDFNCVDSAFVSVEVEGGIEPYTVTWSSGASGTEAILPSGNFALTVVDDLGCTVSYASIVPDSFYVDLIIFDETCNLACDGSIFTSVFGGSSPYVFDWNTGADSANIFPLHSDTFEITVTDGSGCLAYGVGIVDAPDPIEVEFISDTILCGADPFADVSINVTGGKPPYTYIWSTGDSTTTVPDFPIDSMLTLIVQDSTTCYVFDTFYHSVHDELAVLMNIDADECGGNPDGFITLDVLDGEGPFQYQWSNNSTSSVLFGLNAGQYSVTVTNDEGCTGVATGLVETINSPLNAFIVASPPSSCLAADGTIFVQGEGGIGPYTFAWSNGQTGPSLVNLTAGFYTVTINDPLNCPIIREVDLNVYDAIDVEVLGEANLCEEGDSIFLQATILNGTAPFDYSWNTGDTSLGIWVDTAGTYVFSVSDSLGCLGKDVVFVGDGTELIVELFFEDLDCAGDFNATAYVNLYYETGDPVIQWSTGDDGAVLQDLGAGTYSVTVTDDLDCPQVFDFEIEAPDPIEFTIETTDPNCFGAQNGRIEIFIDNPSASILWDSGASSFSLDDLSAGTYGFTLSDGQGCDLDTFAVLFSPEELLLSLELSQINCDQQFGYILSSVSGGTAPYSYLWSNGDTSPFIENLTSDYYTLVVTDALGCVAEQADSIFVYNPISIELEAQSPLCDDEANGSISSSVFNGNGNYSYLWSTGSTQTSIDGLVAGTYSLTVCDEDLCCAEAEISIEDPELLDIAIDVFPSSCPDTQDAYAIVTATGGTGDYTYIWSSGNSNGNNSGALSPGDYSVTVEDENACSAELPFTVFAADELDYELVVEQIICPDDQLGSAEVIADFNIVDSVLWFGPNLSGFNSPILDNVEIAGTYTYVIYYEVCTVEGEIVFEEPDLMSWETILINGECGAGLGSIELFVDGGNPPYSYLWSTGETTSSIEDLENGLYSVVVTDDLGCTFEDDFLIENQSAVTLSAEIMNPNCFDSEDGSITVFPSGGLLPYTYVWSTGSSATNILSGLGEGEVSLTVCDAEGCCVSETFFLEAPEPISADLSVLQLPCIGESNGSIELILSGGTVPYMIEWSTGMTGVLLEDVAAGTYGFTVTDEAGCAYEDEFTLDNAEEIEVEVTVEMTCYGGNNGSINLNITQGLGPFEVLWSNGSTGTEIVDLGVGDYAYTITDASGCSIEDLLSVTEEELTVCEIVLVEAIVDCESTNGALEVITDDSIEEILWSNGALTGLISDLPAGDYSVTLSDDSGCISECSYTLTAPNALGDYVWYDLNADGIQNGIEEGLEGVEIILFDENGAILASTFSGPDGYYSFTGLVDGIYYVQVIDDLDEFILTAYNVGSDDSLDSDIDPLTGVSDMVSLSGGICYEDLDIGFSDDCIPIVDPGAIGFDQELCGQYVVTDELVETMPATGGSQPYEYVWLFSTNFTPVNSGTWTMIPDSNSPNYQPNPLSISTYFIRCVRAEGCEAFQESNVVFIDVTPSITANFLGPSEVCVDDVNTYTATDNDEPVNYEWYLDGILLDLPADASTVDLEFSSTGVYQLLMEITFDDCIATYVENIFVYDDPQTCSTAPIIDNGSGDLEFGQSASTQMDIELVPSLVYEGLKIEFKNFSQVDVSSWTVRSLTGRIMEKDIRESDFSTYLNTEVYPAGVYIINLRLNNGSMMTKRFIKVD